MRKYNIFLNNHLFYFIHEMMLDINILNKNENPYTLCDVRSQYSWKRLKYLKTKTHNRWTYHDIHIDHMS